MAIISNVTSGNISIFPIAKVRDDQRSRLLYEENVSNIIRQLIDTTGFIKHCSNNLTEVTQDSITYLNVQSLIFNIYGYYVDINNVNIRINSNSKYVYASIKLNSSSPIEIQGQDEFGLYKGLELLALDEDDYVNNKYSEKSIVVEGDCSIVYLKLFEKDGSWKLCDTAYDKFDLSRLISGIDGKVN